MNKRIIFKNKSSRQSFFNEILSSSGFSSWRELYTAVQIPKSRFEFYKTGTHSIPFERYHRLVSFLTSEKKKDFDNQLIFLDPHWGQQKGGKITYSKHKHIFENGRKCAWKKFTPTFDYNLVLTEALCEFLGAFIGDGFTNHYSKHYIVQFVGDSRYDNDYHQNFLASTAHHYFHVNPKIQIKENAIQTTIYSKSLFLFLTKRFQFPAGVKSYTVKIPNEILSSNTSFQTGLLRGLYNTDGCIYFDKRPSYKLPYPRVHIQLINAPLIKQIYSLLLSLGLTPTITRSGYVIQINGFDNVRNFLKTVGFSNQRHIQRIRKNYPSLLV